MAEHRREENQPVEPDRPHVAWWVEDVLQDGVIAVLAVYPAQRATDEELDIGPGFCQERRSLQAARPCADDRHRGTLEVGEVTMVLGMRGKLGIKVTGVRW